MGVAARFVPWPALTSALRYAQMLLVLTGIGVYVRQGIRMRRGVWTAQSWRRFLTSVVVSLAGIAVMIVFSLAVDNRSAWVGEGGSARRHAIGLTIITVGIVGVFMFAGALNRFATDEPAKQYESRLSRMWLRVSGRS